MKPVKVYPHRVDESLQSDRKVDTQLPIAATHDGDFTRSAIICPDGTGTFDIIAADGKTHLARLILYGKGDWMSIDVVSDQPHQVEIREDGVLAASAKPFDPSKAVTTLYLQKKEGGNG